MGEDERSAARVARFNEALGSRYRVERELATGGTATVFLATDLKYQRPVAVKVFRPEVAEAMGHERFIREIAFVATLNHPHIVPLLDSGEAEELLYYVMPAVEGHLNGNGRDEVRAILRTVLNSGDPAAIGIAIGVVRRLGLADELATVAANGVTVALGPGSRREAMAPSA